MAKTTKITAHSLNDPKTSPSIIAGVLRHLREPAYFQIALALYRRLQFGRFFDSSYLFTNLDLSLSSQDASKSPWFYAFVDRGCRPETEVWLFGSWEVDEQNHTSRHVSSNGDDTNGHTLPNSTSTFTSTKDAEIHSLLLSFIDHINSLPTPPSIHAPEDVLAAQSQIISHNSGTINPPTLPNPGITLWGAIHSTTTAHLNTLNLLCAPLLPPFPNHTFLFPLSSLPQPPPLPGTLRWGKLEKQHYALVRSRTEIARQDLTLSGLRHLAIFSASAGSDSEATPPAPIAWAFIGLDGSLTSLHVEESHRRLGLAKALTIKLFHEAMEVFWEDGVEKLAHGNVAVGNGKSAGMCRSLGGVDVGEVFWVRVDVGGASYH